MMGGWRRALARCSRLLARTPVARIPVRVRKGLAKGARWTLLPYSAYWRGCYERDVDAAIASLGELCGRSCWDLGTHFGIHTVGLAMRVGPEGQVAGFEVDPVSFSRYQQHVAMNNLKWVKLFNRAVSSTDGIADLMHYGEHGSPTTHLSYPGEIGHGARRVPVQTVALDSLVESGEIRLPDVIKIDVEGHGAEALSGAARAVARSLPHIIMGFHSVQEYRRTQAFLEPLGYSLFSCSTGVRHGWPIGYEDAGGDTYLLKASTSR